MNMSNFLTAMSPQSPDTREITTACTVSLKLQELQKRVRRPKPSTFQRHLCKEELQWSNRSRRCIKTALHRSMANCSKSQEASGKSVRRRTCTKQALQMVPFQRAHEDNSHLWSPLWRKSPVTETSKHHSELHLGSLKTVQVSSTVLKLATTAR